MKHNVSLGFVYLLTLGVLSPFAKAQCPNNPLSLLDGTTWAFRITGDVAGANASEAGTFTASAISTTSNPLPAGVGQMLVTETFNIEGSASRQEVNYGRYQMNQDCAGGTLFFDGNQNYHLQFDFWFFNGGKGMYVVSISNGSVFSGTASKT